MTIKLICRSILDVSSPFTVLGHYKATNPAGAVKLFDRALDGWITQALAMGMAGCGLGELFLIPTRDKLPANTLILAGMGEPGGFTADDLRYLMANIAFAVRSMDTDRLCTLALGTGKGGMRKNLAVPAMIEGVRDALERLSDPAARRLELTLVEFDRQEFEEVAAALAELERGNDISNLILEITVEKPAALAEAAGVSPAPVRAQRVSPPTTRIMISRSPTDSLADFMRDRVVAVNQGSMASTGAAVASSLPPIPELTFDYAALSESAVIPLREEVVQAYFVQRLTQRLKNSETRKDQEIYGRLLTYYLFPQDFLRVLEDGDSLTLVLDSETVPYPWEMAGFKTYRGTEWLGPFLKLTRQFRTLASSEPGIAPPVNNALRVLVIADPAKPPYNLPGAKDEGFGVVKVFQQARDAWKEALDLQVDLRVGYPTPEIAKELVQLKSTCDVIRTADSCDPLEILGLILDEPYDVIHFAGHGVYDPATNRKGWFFEEQCILSAREIFKVRQVPRLVFANACHSAEIDESARPLLAQINQRIPLLRQQASLAEAFFERGIQNYIGTGWKVNDDAALLFAKVFYRMILGLPPREDQAPSNQTTEPARLGDAMARSRRAVLGTSSTPGSTWGAYQHYGDVDATLISFSRSD